MNQFEQAVDTLRRYCGAPQKEVVELVELLGVVNDDLYHMRAPVGSCARIRAACAKLVEACGPRAVREMRSEELLLRESVVDETAREREVYRTCAHGYLGCE